MYKFMWLLSSSHNTAIFSCVGGNCGLFGHRNLFSWEVSKMAWHPCTTV